MMSLGLPTDYMVELYSSIYEGKTPISPSNLIENGWIKDADGDIYRYKDYQIFKGQSGVSLFFSGENPDSWKMTNMLWDYNLDFISIERLTEYMNKLHPQQ